jgi:hypothetical protein
MNDRKFLKPTAEMDRIINETEYWHQIQALRWEERLDFESIAEELSEIPEQRDQLSKFVDDAVALLKERTHVDLEALGSENETNALLYHIVGLGRAEFVRALEFPETFLVGRFNYEYGGYDESFAYCFLEPENARELVEEGLTSGELIDLLGFDARPDARVLFRFWEGGSGCGVAPAVKVCEQDGPTIYAHGWDGKESDEKTLTLCELVKFLKTFAPETSVSVRYWNGEKCKVSPPTEIFDEADGELKIHVRGWNGGKDKSKRGTLPDTIQNGQH